MSLDEYHIKQAHSAIDALAAELATAKRELEEQKALTCGKLMPVTKYPMGQAMASVSSYHSPKEAKKEIEALYQRCLSLKDANQAAIKNNATVYDGLRKLIAAIGIPSSYNKVVNRRSYKTESVSYDWTEGLRHLVPTHDDWPDVQKTYEQKMSEVAKWEEKIAAEESEKERQRESEAKNIEKIKTLGILANKYGLALSTEDHEILDAILSKDKYLALGHSLLLNRGDWSDGPDYARCGLDRFEVVSDTDRAIYAELHDLIDDWQGDGRCFRDADYSYDRLFGMVDTALLADYKTLMRFEC
ncbi:MAG: hypothetical protein PHS46_07845 [Candidatus Omnitrophica bacterium]|nr:hypothetical protein [Candidatus Omnitrophota bacterium]